MKDIEMKVVNKSSNSVLALEDFPVSLIYKFTF